MKKVFDDVYINMGQSVIFMLNITIYNSQLQAIRIIFNIIGTNVNIRISNSCNALIDTYVCNTIVKGV
eukprot:Awhi_evm1s1205